MSTKADTARRKLNHAVRRGRIIRPKFCEQCGCEPTPGSDGRSTLHAHHHRGYDLPLEVLWLCVKCHFQHDPRPSGTANGRAKVSAEQVAAIRAEYRPDAKWWKPEGGARWLARKYGLHNRTITRIVRGEIWSDAALSEK